MHKYEGNPNMKHLLLASASVFAFAGAAAAEVTFAGSATLGYNDDDLATVSDDNVGFYWDANIAVTLSQELDNGVTASVTFDFDAADNDTGSVFEGGSYLLSLTADMGGLYYGDTAYAAETYWSSAGDMESDGFSEADGEVVLRGELVYSSIRAGVSYVVADSDGNSVNVLNGEDVEQLSVGAAGSFGAFTFSAAYQEEADGTGAFLGNEDFNDNEIFAISAGGSFAGADITVGYAQQTTSGDFQSTSTGVQVAYPLGPVTLTAYYVMEDQDGGYTYEEDERNFGIAAAYASGPISATLDYQDDQGVTKVALDATYDMGNGLSVLAGYYLEDGSDLDAGNPKFADDFDEFYIAGSVDLGGGADFVIAYAEGDDEVGDPEYENGITAELTLEF